MTLISGIIMTDKLCPETVKSLDQFCDEIIIVWTGEKKPLRFFIPSRRFRVLHRPWEKSFSIGRNYGIKDAKGRWIYFLDSDEKTLFENPKTGPKELRDYLRACKDYTAFKIPVRNTLPGGDGFHSIPRLFFNQPELHFTRRIQNKAVGTGKMGTLGEIEILHTGYEDREKMREKEAVRKELYELELEENPNDAEIWYHYTKNRYICRDISEANEAGRKALQMLLDQGRLGPDSPLMDIYRVLGRIRLHLGDFYGADSLLLNSKDSALVTAPRYFDAYPELALTHDLLAQHFRKLHQAEVALWRQQRQVYPWEVVSAKREEDEKEHEGPQGQPESSEKTVGEGGPPETEETEERGKEKEKA
jgi:glycosyltransferase involved in cell wall biosynthesis